MAAGPADAVEALERAPRRQFARLMAEVARWFVQNAPVRVPHALAWRLSRLVEREPPPLAVYRGRSGSHGGARALIVSNDLSFSGAPQIVVELARLLTDRGAAVTVASPVDGGRAAQLVEVGANVVVCAAVRAPESDVLTALAGAADIAICNTVMAAHAVVTLSRATPTVWYLHETALLADQMAQAPEAREAMARAARVWAVSEPPGALVRPFRPDVTILPYGLESLGQGQRIAADPRLRLAVFGSMEPRKGQDLLLEAVTRLAPAVRAQLSIALHGRCLFPDFHARLAAMVAEVPEVTLGEALDPTSYNAVMLKCDAVVVPSRDDPLPIVAADAMGSERVTMCTATTGTAAFIRHGIDGFVAAAAEPDAIAAMLTEAVERRADWATIAARGREVFDRRFSKPAFAAAVERELAALGVFV